MLLQQERLVEPCDRAQQLRLLLDPLAAEQQLRVGCSVLEHAVVVSAHPQETAGKPCTGTVMAASQIKVRAAMV